jgi:hypothetical protein
MAAGVELIRLSPKDMSVGVVNGSVEGHRPTRVGHERRSVPGT